MTTEPSDRGARARSAAGAGEGGAARWSGVLGLLVTVVIWGSTVPAIAVLSARWDPYFLAMIRYVAALPLFWILLLVLERPGAPAAVVAPWRLMVLGTAMAGFATFFTMGVAHSNPATAVVFVACMPIIASLVGWMVQGSVPDRGLYFGIALVVPGAMLAMLNESSSNVPVGSGGGEPLIVIAMVCWSWYSVMVQRWMPGSSALRITARTSTASSLVLVVIYGIAILGGQTFGAWHAVTALDVSLMALLAYGVIVIAVIFWNRGVARLGLPRASLFLNLIPAVTLAVLTVMGILPSLGQVLGAVLVVAGILVAQRFKGRKATR